MKSLNFNKIHLLITCFILSLTILSPVYAVTDAELEALEKQIEQQEAESIKKIEEKRKAEQEQQRQTEIQAKEKRKKEMERQRQTELAEKNKEEEMKKELERKIKEEEKLRAEKEREEKLNAMLADAKNAESSNDYNLALTKYNNILNDFPNNAEAITNIDRIKSILKNCEAIVGEWVWFNGASMVYNSDRTFVWNLFISGGGSWECINPGDFEFYMTFPNNPQWSGPIWVVDNGKKLKGKGPNVFGGEFMGHKPEQDENKSFKGL